MRIVLAFLIASASLLAQYTPPSGGGGGAPSGPAGGGLAGTYPNPTVVGYTPTGSGVMTGPATSGTVSPTPGANGIPQLDGSSNLSLPGNIGVGSASVLTWPAKNASNAIGGYIGSGFFNPNAIFVDNQILLDPNVSGSALGELTAQNGYFIIKAENAPAQTFEPGFFLVASSGTDSGSILSLYGSGFSTSGNTSANSAFYILNVTNGGNTYYDVMDTRLTPSLNVSGCTGATLAADSTNWVGQITSLPTGSCTIVMTMAVSSAEETGVAHHGWTCALSDLTTANLFRVSANSTSTVTFTGTAVSGDTLQYGPCGSF